MTLATRSRTLLKI
ncbi:unnamed protein product [Debaryomyces fabryi]|nr:unnamed protein product [Debaryomyces fabryi]